MKQNRPPFHFALCLMAGVTLGTPPAGAQSTPAVRVVPYFHTESGMVNVRFILENTSRTPVRTVLTACPVRYTITDAAGTVVYTYPAKNAVCPSTASIAQLLPGTERLIGKAKLPLSTFTKGQTYTLNTSLNGSWTVGGKAGPTPTARYPLPLNW